MTIRPFLVAALAAAPLAAASAQETPADEPAATVAEETARPTVDATVDDDYTLHVCGQSVPLTAPASFEERARLLYGVRFCGITEVRAEGGEADELEDLVAPLVVILLTQGMAEPGIGPAVPPQVPVTTPGTVPGGGPGIGPSTGSGQTLPREQMQRLETLTQFLEGNNIDVQVQDAASAGR